MTGDPVLMFSLSCEDDDLTATVTMADSKVWKGRWKNPSEELKKLPERQWKRLIATRIQQMFIAGQNQGIHLDGTTEGEILNP